MVEVVTFAVDQKVRTTVANLSLRDEWTERAWEQKRWGVEGTIIAKHNSHGVSFEVRHEDETKASYDPLELELI